MLRKLAHILILISIALGLIFPSKLVFAEPLKQGLSDVEKAEALLEGMTPEERVGQVFLVTFSGTDTGEGSKIRDLIENWHIGGVVLRADNDNFSGPENTTGLTQQLIKEMQLLNWQFSQTASIAEGNGINSFSTYTPLLVGISQEGDLAPYDQIINGMTSMPNQMAIGATWKPQNAESVGSILGLELNALGFNLLFGPSLDVLDVVRVDSGENLGVRTFGGDPYWVGEFGSEYVKGVHSGSHNQIAVIATHFPGRGGSDRQPDEEIATVRKSLEQLKQIELAPFFTVTDVNEDPSTQVDGLLLSHIRYQGFQGNIRATTKPVSFDSTALAQIMELPEFADWREQRGIVVSDDLGTAAVKKFFDPAGTNFDPRQVAKSALLAGNDVLYLGNILGTNDEDSYTTTTRIIDFFVQKYKEDTAFQVKVDEAAKRVLTLKFKLYSEFSIVNILPQTIKLDLVGKSKDKVTNIAQDAATLISPGAADIDSVMPDPPQRTDRIVFISNKIPQKQCSTCADQSIFLANELKNAVVRLYGPNAGEQIVSGRLTVYSYDDLNLMLNNGENTENILNDLSLADWIVFAFTDFRKTQPEAIVFKEFFDLRPNLSRNKKIIGFGFNAPYSLDATDISKLTAYYIFYSKTSEYFDVAARILFQELIPKGASPVSIAGTGYDLITITTPSPDQVIPLIVEAQDTELTIGETPVSGNAQPLLYKAGDLIPIQTGIIKDHNGNKVPDGTIVRFIIDRGSTSGSVEQIEAQTANGIARTTYRIPDIGIIEIRAVAEPALVSQILQLDITETGGMITSFEPTPADGDDGSLPVLVPTPTQVIKTPDKHIDGKLTFLDWFFSSLLIMLTIITYHFLARKGFSRKWLLRITLSMGTVGYLSYLYLAFGFPGADQLVRDSGTPFVVLIVLIGIFGGMGFGYLLYRLEKSRKKLSQKGDE